MRMRRKPNLEKRLEQCAHLLIPQPETLRGKWLQTFGGANLHLELGCGKGRFITETARANPTDLFVALEKSDNVIVAALELAVRENISNIKFINTIADDLEAFFSKGELSRIFINFCDPWPLNKHKKRRLTSKRFLEQYKEILQPSGEVHLKTDDLSLYEFSLKELRDCEYSIVETSKNLHENGRKGIMTEYEQKFYERELPIHWCRAKICE